ncbi:hypothetical protein MKX01_037099, partial [Papaver californicum]
IFVVLFCNKLNDQKALVFMEQLSKRNQSLNFIKDVQKRFRIKEIPGTSLELLESTVKFYTTS